MAVWDQAAVILVSIHFKIAPRSRTTMLRQGWRGPLVSDLTAGKEGPAPTGDGKGVPFGSSVKPIVGP